MADNNDRSRFNLRQRVESLVGLDGEEPDAKSFDSKGTIANRPYTVESDDYDRTEAPDDEMERYWRQYETTPMIRKPVQSFAARVVEPGYYVDADHLSEDERNRLRNWLEQCAILEGELGQDFRNLAKKSVIQREVRGTSVVEKVPAEEDEEKLVALKFLNPETLEVVTRPNQSILLKPDDVNADWLETPDDLPKTDDGEAAAYLQDISETGQSRFGDAIDDRYRNTNKVAFTRDEIIKMTRDADVGEVFGTSRVEAVSERVEGLKRKLEDNDEAIASKAYPLWLFMFGNEENPWDRDDIRSFMKSHEMDNFHPGMKQGVRGDVSVETISGEVAQIAEYLQFDVDYIISAMPMPKYAIGGYIRSESVGQIAGAAQQQDVQRQINDTRREIESKFTPMLREKARELGLSEPNKIRLGIGDPNRSEDSNPGANENIIRYLGQGDDDQQSQSGVNGNESDSPPDEGDSPESEENALVEPQSVSWTDDYSLAELSMSDDEQATIADAVYDTLDHARENILQHIDEKSATQNYNDAQRFEGDANNAMSTAQRESNIRDRIRQPIEKELTDISDEYGPGFTSRFTNRQRVNTFQQNVINSTKDAMEGMMREIRTMIRREMQTGDNWMTVRGQIREKFDDMKLRGHAEIITHMETYRMREAAKLMEFERNGDVVGVRVTNDDSSTPLCESLQGIEAYFDDGDIRQQIADETRDELLHEGFDPLPSTPPYHYGCDTELEPILGENVDERSPNRKT